MLMKKVFEQFALRHTSDIYHKRIELLFSEDVKDKPVILSKIEA